MNRAAIPKSVIRVALEKKLLGKHLGSDKKAAFRAQVSAIRQGIESADNPTQPSNGAPPNHWETVQLYSNITEKPGENLVQLRLASDIISDHNTTLNDILEKCMSDDSIDMHDLPQNMQDAISDAVKEFKNKETKLASAIHTLSAPKKRAENDKAVQRHIDSIKDPKEKEAAEKAYKGPRNCAGLRGRSTEAHGAAEHSRAIRQNVADQQSSAPATTGGRTG